MQPSDLSLLRAVSRVALSPDGCSVAYVVAGVDLAANRTRSQIWLAATDGSTAPRPLTAGDGRDDGPAWSPDGRTLAFASDRHDGGSDPDSQTLHLIAVDGVGETITLARGPEKFDELAWSPDGRWLAFCQRTPTEDAAVTDERARPPRRITRFFSRLDSEGWTFDRPRHLKVIAADGSLDARDLTPGEFEFQQPVWLADSLALICAAAAHDTWDVDLETHLHVVPLDGERRQLTNGPLSCSSPTVSPDGTMIAFTGHDNPLIDPQNGRIGVVPIGGGERRWLDTGLDRTWAPYPAAGPPIWLDRGALLAPVEDRGDTHLYRVPVDGSPIEQVVGGSRAVMSFDAAADVVVASVSTADRPGEVHAWRGGVETRLSDATRSFVEATGPIVPDRIVAGDHEIDAWVFLPPGFDPSARHSSPMLVDIHGGPFTQYGNHFFDEAQVQASAGYVVVLSNPRGGSGRDTSWTRAISGPKSSEMAGTGWGSVDAEDIETVLDTVLDRYPAVDPARVGVIGGSYGGYLVTWLIGHTDRFAAACSERAVNNMATMEWTSDIATVFRTELGVTHLDDPAEYARMSPITYVRDIHTPVLIVHSEDDLRCPISQAEELFVALRTLGREVEFVRFPGESHELSRSGSPVHRRQRFEVQLEFFDRHLRPSPATV
jgi:dipeptidyl aminopeptidase/acylaminoacyl peptidase